MRIMAERTTGSNAHHSNCSRRERLQLLTICSAGNYQARQRAAAPEVWSSLSTRSARQRAASPVLTKTNLFRAAVYMTTQNTPFVLTVDNLTEKQIQAFLRHGVSLKELPTVLEEFSRCTFGRDYNFIEGVLPWCNLHGGIDSNGVSHT